MTRPERKATNPRMILISLLASLLVPTVSPSQDGWEDRELTVFDQDGARMATLGEPARYWGAEISPDGSKVAVTKPYGSESWSDGDLWVFDVGTGRGTRVATAAPRASLNYPVWSPDGTEVAYVESGTDFVGVYKAPADGNGEEELLFAIENALWPYGVTDWSADGRFLMYLNGQHLYVQDLTGTSDPKLIAPRTEFSQFGTAQLSPDGKFIAYASTDSGDAQLWVRRVSIGEDSDPGVPRSWQASTDGVGQTISWSDDGKTLYYLNRDLDVMRLDVETGEEFEFGTPEYLFSAPDRAPEATLSNGGTRLVVPLPPPPPLERIAIVDRRGRVVEHLGPPGLYSAPALSEDGTRVAVLREDPRTAAVDVWTFAVETGEARRLTSDAFRESPPVWSPGGDVVYVSRDGDYRGIYSRRWDGAGDPELLYRHTPGAPMWIDSFSSDGRFLSFSSGAVVYLVDLSEEDALERGAIPFVQEAFAAGGSQFSPDSRFVAYGSNASGNREVYLQPFDAARKGASGAPVPVSSEGARTGPTWGRNTGELYFLDADRESPGLMAAAVSTAPVLQLGEPDLLFRFPYRIEELGAPFPDGERFVFIVPWTGDDADNVRFDEQGRP